MNDAQRSEQLRMEIRRHDHLYYVEAKPEIPDRQYDQLMQELKDLEAKHPELVTADSPTQRVSGRPIEGFASVRHPVPMLSIDNTYNEEEVRAFDARVRKALGDRKFQYMVDPKIDGLSLSLRYEKGLMVLAATRGDGATGDDVTVNVRAIRAVPLRLTGKDVPDVLEVRGEVYWPRKAFAAFNAQRAAEGRETFANPRNGAAGTLKQLDAKVVAARGLSFVAHGLGEMSAYPARSAVEINKHLARWGIPVNPHTKLCKDIDEVLAAIHQWLTTRNEVDYETDGMVVKVDDLDLRAELGQTSKYPRWCIAYKYEAQRAETILREVDFQVGRLGTITPVAHFDPVHISGTKVSNASLHNFDQVERLDARVGDSILVEKAGEIIPQVVQVDFQKRPRDARPITPPAKCPVCGGKAVREEDEVALRCSNPECPAQIRQRLEFWCGRNQMDIEDVGPAMIDELVTQGKVKTIADFYHLKPDDLAGQELSRHTREDGREVIARIQPALAKKLCDAIEASKTRGLERVLAGLGIHHVGGRVAEVLAKHFGDIDKLSEASAEEIDDAPEIGPVIAQSVHDFFHSPSGKAVVKHMKEAGLTLTHARRHGAGAGGGAAGETGGDGGAGGEGPGPLEGKTVVVTGTLEKFSRSQAEQAIKDAGGRVTSSVSKNTDFVVVGADAGSKADKAKLLGVEMIDEKEFTERLGK